MSSPGPFAALTRLRVAVPLCVALLYIGAAWLKCHHYADNPTALIGFGCYSDGACWSAQNAATLPPSAVVFQSGGYDGQFFYYIAQDLFGGPSAVVDSAPFRWARIGLPLIAGPVVRAGEWGAVFGIPTTLLVLHLISVIAMQRARGEGSIAALLFAVNPFSLMSFLLSVADGAALSLAVMGSLALTASRRRLVTGGVLLVAALLTKETLVVVPAALAASWFFDANLSWRTRFGLCVLCAATLLPLLLWWNHVGLSLGLVAARGGFPMVGMAQYLARPDLTRGLLALTLVLAVLTGAILAGNRVHRAAGFALLGTAALVSTATASEYWPVTANIARLFTPMVAALALSGWPPSGAAWQRWPGITWASCLVILSVVTVVREATRRPLGYSVLPGEAPLAR